MADRKSDGQSTGRPLANVVGDHRLNDINCGHLGRLTYIPVDNEYEQTGRLHTTRNTDLTTHFQQITPLEQLDSPSRTIVPESKSRPWRAVRSQKNWLLKSHPEALPGGADFGPLLSQENRDLRVSQSSTATSAPLALGEIRDLRIDRKVVGHPAVAFTGGEGSHTLQILAITTHDRGWDNEGIMIRPSYVLDGGRGEWADDGMPISSIKFAVDLQIHDPIRWIMVQKPTSTTVLEPEIRKTPLRGSRSGGHESWGTFHIAANPLFTIPADKTGGGPQSDVSFNPLSGSAPPQLVIINTAGHWSIWDITGNRAARPKLLTPILRTCGSVGLGLLAALPLVSQDSRTAHRVSWIPRPKVASSKRQSHAGQSPRLQSRSDHILICNDTALRVISVADGKFRTGFNVARPSKGERILDFGFCPFDHSKVFVLTTTRLFWLSNEPVGKDGVRLAVVISSPHYMKLNGNTLRLGVSPTVDLGHMVACFACVYSSADSQATAFWFTEPTTEKPAQFLYRTISLGGHANLESMAISSVPGGRPSGERETAHNHEATSALRHSRFFQLFVLGSDMSLGSFLIAWSPFPFGDVEPPTSRRIPRRSIIRKKLFRHLGEVFVVPDEFDDNTTLPGSLAGHTTGSGTGEGKRRGRATADFTFLSAQLQQNIRERIVDEAAVAEVPTSNFATIRGVIEGSLAEFHPTFHLLSEIAENRLGRADVDSFLDAWVAYRDELQADESERLSVIGRSSYLFHPDNRSLRESIERQALLPEAASEMYLQRQERVIRHVTVEVYMSLLGVSVSPAPIELPDAEDVEPEDAGSQTMSLIVERSSPGSVGSVSSSRRRGSSRGRESSQGVEDDPVISRLRKYLPTAAGIQPRAGHQSLLLSHWPEEPGSDPKEYSWKPEESEADEEINHRRRKREEARRRRLEKRLPSSQPDEAGESSTQPLPRIGGIHSSQTQTSSSQVQVPPSSLFANQPMSQVMPGIHGGRPPQLKKKPKIKGGGRTRGFR